MLDSYRRKAPEADALHLLTFWGCVMLQLLLSSSPIEPQSTFHSAWLLTLEQRVTPNFDAIPRALELFQSSVI